MKKRFTSLAGEPISSLSEENASSETSSLSAVSKRVNNSSLLFEAVKSGKDILVQNLICSGIPLSISDQFGGSLIYYAARYNRENILKMLIAKTEDLIDYPTKMRRTPLQVASYHGHEKIVKILINNRTNVNSKDRLGMTALHWAAENNHAKVVSLLLEAGADRTQTNTFGKTALCLASAKNNYGVCEILQDLHKLNSEYLNFGAGSGRNEEFHANELLKDCVQENETIKLFEQHGIKMLPVDQSTTIANALERGQTAVLTEAGRMALKKTESAFLRSISNMTNSASCKKMKVDEKSSVSSDKVENENKLVSPKTKFVKIDARQIANITSCKKLMSSRSSKLNFGKCNESKMEAASSASNVFAYCNNQQTDQTKALEFELQNKLALIRDMKKQLDLSMRLTEHYKTKYELKKKEAELCKAQLVNLSRMLTNSGFKIVNIES